MERNVQAVKLDGGRQLGCQTRQPDSAIYVSTSFHLIRGRSYSPSAGSDVSNSEIIAAEVYLRVDKIAIKLGPEVVL